MSDGLPVRNLLFPAFCDEAGEHISGKVTLAKSPIFRGASPEMA